MAENLKLREIDSFRCEGKRIAGLAIIYTYRRAETMSEEDSKKLRKQLEDSAGWYNANAYMKGREMWFPSSDGMSYYAVPVTFFKIE